MALVHEADGPRARDAILKIAQRRARASAYTRRVAGEDVSTLGRLRPKRVQQAEHRCARVTNEGVQSQQIGSAKQDRSAWRVAGNKAATDHRPNGNHDGLDLRRATSTTGADPEGLD
jgi:hypothetical protein